MSLSLDVCTCKDMTGREFNTLFPNIDLIKLTNENDVENETGFQYNDGLNIADVKTNAIKGGFYFTPQNRVLSWIYNDDQFMTYVRKVTLPNDARIYICDSITIITDKFNLGPKQQIDSTVYLDFMRLHAHLTYDDVLFKKLLRFFETKHDQIAKEFYSECAKYDDRSLELIPFRFRDICIQEMK